MICKQCGKEAAIIDGLSGRCIDCRTTEWFDDGDSEDVLVISCPHCKEAIKIKILRR